MGMFDSIKVDQDNICNIALPKREYQTYDLDNQCWTFRITREGKLVVESKATNYSSPFDKQFEQQLQDSHFSLYAINNNEYCGVISFGGDVEDTGEWVDYLLLIHNSEVQYVTRYGDVVYSRDPESNNDFQAAIDSACQPLRSVVHDIMFQKMMSTKHFIRINPGFKRIRPEPLDINLTMPSEESRKASRLIAIKVMNKLGMGSEANKDIVFTEQEEKDIENFTEKLNSQFPGVINNGVFDMFALVRGRNGDINPDIVKQSGLGTFYQKICDGDESRSASHSLMTKEDAEKGVEKEIQARKAKLLKGENDGN